MRFSSNIKSLRDKYNLTQEELADIFRVERTTAGKWENTNTIPHPDLLQNIAKYFNVSIDFLLGYEPLLDSENNIALLKNNLPDDEIELLNSYDKLSLQNKDRLFEYLQLLLNSQK